MAENKGSAAKRLVAQIKADSGGKNDGGKAMMRIVRSNVATQSKQAKRS